MSERDGDVGMSGFAGNSNDSTFSDVYHVVVVF